MANLDAIELLNEFGQANPDVFGGMRIAVDGLVIYFCRDVEKNIKEAIANLTESGVTAEGLRAESCEFSLRDLTTTADELSDQMQRLNEAGADIRGISVDVTRNRVVVSLGPDDVSTSSKIRNANGRIVEFERQTAETFPVSRKHEKA